MFWNNQLLLLHTVSLDLCLDLEHMMVHGPLSSFSTSGVIRVNFPGKIVTFNNVHMIVLLVSLPSLASFHDPRVGGCTLQSISVHVVY